MKQVPSQSVNDFHLQGGDIVCNHGVTAGHAPSLSGTNPPTHPDLIFALDRLQTARYHQPINRASCAHWIQWQMRRVTKGITPCLPFHASLGHLSPKFDPRTWD